MTSYFGRFFTHAGVLAVFKPRRGRLKIPVAPTGKLKLHVFPLRRAKENKHFGSFSDVLSMHPKRVQPKYSTKGKMLQTGRKVIPVIQLDENHTSHKFCFFQGRKFGYFASSPVIDIILLV